MKLILVYNIKVRQERQSKQKSLSLKAKKSSCFTMNKYTALEMERWVMSAPLRREEARPSGWQRGRGFHEYIRDFLLECLK